jgi:hypothetical protein
VQRRTGHLSLTSKQRSAHTLDQLEPGAQGMLPGHTLAKTIGQWGLVVTTGAVGLAAGAVGFTLLGLDGIFRVLHDFPAAAVGAALSVLLALAAMAGGALIAVARERFRNRLARIALNNMTQGLCMFDGAARLVLCNMRYIEMHHLRREQLRGGMPLRELLVLRIQTGTFSETAKATGEITRQISSVQSSGGDAVAAIRAITQHMQDINSHTLKVVGAIEHQELATGEILHNVAGAAAGSKAVVAALDDVATGLTQTRSSAETVLAASEEVENATVKLRAEVEDFLSTVAA